MTLSPRIIGSAEANKSINFLYKTLVRVLDVNLLTTVSYTEGRVRLASLLDEVVSSREEVIIKRRGNPDVALIAADEISSL